MKQAEDGQFEYLTASRHRSPLVDEHLAYWLAGSPDRFARFTHPLNISRRYIESMRRNDTRRLSPAQILSSAPFIGRVGTPKRTYAFRMRERVWSQRAVVDYALQRRALLANVRRGMAFTSDLCDADPYLLRAAEHHGIAADRPCPLCRSTQLVELSYVYGDELGPFQGRIRAPRELELMAREHGEFRVYVVEVCSRCS